ncbi:seven-hairpin glycosidase [Trichodelitschia bisporula]|uniref:alpha-1,2-Mannosidase n=1 Tax=Trichodelitschia bisporula TaxID=703511 RepID=A0A6G1HI64_9PEZI|nr:seven-hairpin glycosidase [Trichodelitschia bisporula]
MPESANNYDWAEFEAAAEADSLLDTPRGEELRARREAVKSAFSYSWAGYRRYAWNHDELLPVTNRHGDSRNGWGASAIDALSTAIIMDLPDVVDQILEFVPSIDFTTTRTSDPVSLFETTIRYLGGLISGYDLLRPGTGPRDPPGPRARMTKKTALVNKLLTQAISLADALSFAFDPSITPSGIPFNDLDFKGKKPFESDGRKQERNTLATVGTLVLEWTRLSDLVGDPKYANLAQRAQDFLLRPKSSFARNMPCKAAKPSCEVWDGLVASEVFIANGTFAPVGGSWMGGADSFYEYLIKMYVYDSRSFKFYADRWVAAAESTRKFLSSKPVTRPDLTFLAAWAPDGRLIKHSQHLACFAGGNFILGGQVLKNDDYIKYGLELVNGCRQTYEATNTKIGPDYFVWDETNVPADQADFFKKNGFYFRGNKAYLLRPEVIESYYYAYRVTREQKYQDWAWDAFIHIRNATLAESGYTAIQDVMDAGMLDTSAKNKDYRYHPSRSFNEQESFWFAEVLKYSYLIQSDGDDAFQIPRGHGNIYNAGRRKNFWVFNTEAHPVRVRGPPV